MEAEKYKPTSPKRMVKEKANEKDGAQTVDFSIFRRKTNDLILNASDSTISFSKKTSPSILCMLGGIQMICLKSKSPADLFKELQIVNADKMYSQYLNQRTMLEFQRIFKDKIVSFAALADILTHYPISSFFLDIYARQFGLQYLQSTSPLEDQMMMGNQFQVLNDYSCDLRGNALDIVAKSLKLSVCVKYIRGEGNQKFARKSPLGQEEENFGSQDFCAAIQIKNIGKEVIYTLTEHKKNYVPETRKSKIQLLQRKSRIRQSGEGRVSTQNRSLHRQRLCQRCGQKVCQCKILDISEVNTPNNLSKSISGGFAQYNSGPQGKGRMNELGIGGFINVNKIVNRDMHKKT